MKLTSPGNSTELRKIPSQDLMTQSSFAYTLCKNVVPSIDLTRQFSVGDEDNIFQFKEQDQKVLKKRKSMTIKFAKNLVRSFYHASSFIIYFFKEGCTVHDLNENRIYDIDSPFPNVIRCTLLRNDMFLMLTEAANRSARSDQPLGQLCRSIFSFDLKKEKIHQPAEFLRLNIVDFIMINKILLVLTGDLGFDLTSS